MTSKRGSSVVRSMSTDVAGNRNPEQKMPSARQKGRGVECLKRMGFEDLEEIAKGGYGYVYRANYNLQHNPHNPLSSVSSHMPPGKEKCTVAVKLVLTSCHTNLATNASHMRESFNRVLTHNRQEVTREHDKTTHTLSPDTQYFVDDYVFTIPTFPELTCHVMEYLPGVDLFKYFQMFGERLHRYRTRTNEGNNEDNHNHVDDPSYKALMQVFCDIVRAVDFFHRAKVVFNDLKLENAIYTKTSGVVFIDYIDSNRNCKPLSCPETSRTIIRTYEDNYNMISSFAEDIWRLGLMIMDAIILLDSKGHTYYPSEEIVDMMESNPHNYPSDGIHRLIDKCMNILNISYDTDQLPNDELNKFKYTLEKMMHMVPEERPSTENLFNDPMFVFAEWMKVFPDSPITPERYTSKRSLNKVREYLESYLESCARQQT